MKSYSREVAAGVGFWIFVLVNWTFFGASVPAIKELSPIIMGFCSPVFIACLGAFVSKSIQQHMDARVDAAKK